MTQLSISSGLGCDTIDQAVAKFEHSARDAFKLLDGKKVWVAEPEINKTISLERGCYVYIVRAVVRCVPRQVIVDEALPYSPFLKSLAKPKKRSKYY
jgi:hypothetical protein